MLSTYNVFEAARLLGLRRVVWASSETILGLPFEREPPAYAPIDEEHPARPESSYALSKLLAEELGRQLHRWSGTPYVALRFSNIMEPGGLRAVPSFWSDATLRRWNLWGYVDARDVAQSCRLALEADVGAEHFIVAAADTVMNRPSRELMAEIYPSVPYRRDYRRLRHASVDREGPEAAGLPARVVLARPHRRPNRLKLCAGSIPAASMPTKGGNLGFPPSVVAPQAS